MNISTAKRFEYWNHFMARWAVEGIGGGHGVTGTRLHKIQSKVMADDEFWQDIVSRHDGLHQAPETMRQADLPIYEHCLGNFWGMIYQNLVQAKLIKLEGR